MIYTHVLNRGGLGVVSPVDLVVGPGAAVGPRPPEIGRVALPPIAREQGRRAADNRREFSGLPRVRPAGTVRDRPRGPGGRWD